MTESDKCKIKSFSNKQQNLEAWKILGLLILQEIRTSRVCLNDFLIGGLSVGMNHEWTSQWLNGKESACQCRRYGIHGFNTWMGKIPWRRKWQPTLVFLPGKSHRLRSLADCSPWGRKSFRHNSATKQQQQHDRGYYQPSQQRTRIKMELYQQTLPVCTKGDRECRMKWRKTDGFLKPCSTGPESYLSVNLCYLSRKEKGPKVDSDIVKAKPFDFSSI